VALAEAAGRLCDSFLQGHQLCSFHLALGPSSQTHRRRKDTLRAFLSVLIQTQALCQGSNQCLHCQVTKYCKNENHNDYYYLAYLLMPLGVPKRRYLLKLMRFKLRLAVKPMGRHFLSPSLIEKVELIGLCIYG